MDTVLEKIKTITNNGSNFIFFIIIQKIMLEIASKGIPIYYKASNKTYIVNTYIKQLYLKVNLLYILFSI